MKEPFIPKKSDRPLIEISQFDLNVEKRLRQREKFDEMIKEKERYLENEQQLVTFLTFLSNYQFLSYFLLILCVL